MNEPDFIVAWWQNHGYYQIFRREGVFLFYRICGELSLSWQTPRIDPAGALPPLGEKDASFAASSITRFTVYDARRDADCGILFRAGRKWVRLTIVKPTEGACLPFFERELSVPIRDRRFKRRASQIDKQRRERLILPLLGITAATVLLNVVDLFVRFWPLCILAFLSVPVLYGIYLRFPDELSLESFSKFRRERIWMTVPMLVSGAATCLTQALADRSDTDYPSVLPIILVSVVLALLALIPYFFRSHDSKVLALPLAVFFAFYCFAAVSMLNMRLDRTAPYPVGATITEKDTRDTRYGTGYVCELALENGSTYSLWVSQADYQVLRPGDELELTLSDGAFGIPYILWNGDE